MDANKTELGISPVESNRPGSLLDTDMKPVVNELVEKYGQTQRGLKPRHVQLMAIGGSIGTALWVGQSSNSIHDQTLMRFRSASEAI